MKRLVIERLDVDLRGVSRATAETVARQIGPALARSFGAATRRDRRPTASMRVASAATAPEPTALATQIAQRIAGTVRERGDHDLAARRTDRIRTDLIGPIPNVVIFQFNPESLSRTLQIPPRPTGATQRETTQAGEKTFEKITFKAHFSAANMLDEDKVLARLFGIGPQLAALEKMVLPSAKLAGLIGAAIDAIGDALGGGGRRTRRPSRSRARSIRASCSSGA